MQADRTIARRMAELAQRAARTGVAQVAWFLSPAEQAQAEISARQEGVCLYAAGGVPDAERRVVAFAEEDWEPAWPIICLRATWHGRYGAPTHRDFLGAVMAMGIGREKVGDLFIGEGEAHLFVLRDMGQYIAANLERVGNTPVRMEVLSEWPQLAAAEGTEVRATVASVRLDAVLGAVWNLSRGRAAELVASGRVQVDHRPELRADRQLEEGATLSVRGMGRAKLIEIGGKTRKGRIGVTLLRF